MPKKKLNRFCEIINVYNVIYFFFLCFINEPLSAFSYASCHPLRVTLLPLP